MCGCVCVYITEWFIDGALKVGGTCEDEAVNVMCGGGGGEEMLLLGLWIHGQVVWVTGLSIIHAVDECGS